MITSPENDIIRRIKLVGQKIIDKWKSSKAGTVNVDWAAVEKELGFALHENIKDLYSRILGGKRSTVEGVIKFNPKAFVKENVSKEDWLSDINEVNAGRDFCEFQLYLLAKSGTEYVCGFFDDAFKGDWTGGNDFGHRAYIGEIILNIGQVSLIFNNETGRFEWIDIGYGYFDVYEENPYGIIADSAQEFLDKFVVYQKL